MKVRTLDSRDPAFDTRFADLVAVDTAIDREIERVAAAIVDDVKARGDAALLEHTRRLDRKHGTDALECRSDAALNGRLAAAPSSIDHVWQARTGDDECKRDARALSGCRFAGNPAPRRPPGSSGS